MVAELIAEGNSRQRVVEILVKEFGYSRDKAEFAVALELGESEGDVVIAPAPKQ